MTTKAPAMTTAGPANRFNILSSLGPRPRGPQTKWPRRPWSLISFAAKKYYFHRVALRTANEVLEPILESENLRDDFVRLQPQFEDNLFLLASLYKDINKRAQETSTQKSASGSMRALLAERDGSFLSEQALRTVVSGVELTEIIKKDITEYLSSPSLIDTNRARCASSIETWFFPHSLCLWAVVHAILNKNDEWRSNAEELAAWSFAFADDWYAEWGVTSVDIGRVKTLRAL